MTRRMWAWFAAYCFVTGFFPTLMLMGHSWAGIPGAVAAVGLWWGLSREGG